LPSINPTSYADAGEFSAGILYCFFEILKYSESRRELFTRNAGGLAMEEMPKVKMCDTTDCVYNTDRKCHALAITVSSGSNPECQTYITGDHKSGDSSTIAGVGACHAESCEYNRDLMCHASSIDVGQEAGEEAACLTFEVREHAQVE
jgi:hypothetical protein